MSSAHEQITQDEQGQLARQRSTPVYRNYSPVSKSLMEQLIQNLDKILICILIGLLLVFMFHSNNYIHNEPEAERTSLLLDSIDQPNKSPAQEDDKKPFKDLISQLEDDQQVKPPKEQQLPKSSGPLENNQVKQKQDVSIYRYLNHRKRSRYFQQKSREQELRLLKLSKYNLNDPQNSKEQKTQWFQQQKKMLEEKYRLSQFSQKELSMCVVVHASSHNKAHAHQYLLNSIFNQHYSNYILVYVADGYSADQVSTVKQFIKANPTNKNRVKFVWNAQRKYFLESTISAVKAFCMSKRVTVLMDGDDQLLGGQVFQVLNTAYRRYGANLVYGNFIEYHEERVLLIAGFSTQYEDVEKKENLYRSVGQKFGSIKTFKTGLISYIKESDLKDKAGNYYRYAGDYALIYPLIELACGLVHYVPEYNYLYFGYEIDPTFGDLQIRNGQEIREKSKYDCYKKYN